MPVSMNIIIGYGLIAVYESEEYSRETVQPVLEVSWPLRARHQL